MKRNNRFVCAMMFFLFVCVFSAGNVRAASYRVVDLQTLGSISNTPDTIAFWGKVLKVNDLPNSKEYVFEVKEGLRGDLKAGQTINLKFADSSKHSTNAYSMRDFGTPPLIYPGYEVVVFATPNSKKEYFIVGGPGQGIFYVKYYNGEPGFYNSMGNQNFVSTSSDNQYMKTALTQMKEKNTGAVVGWSTFKALLNGDK